MIVSNPIPSGNLSEIPIFLQNLFEQGFQVSFLAQYPLIRESLVLSNSVRISSALEQLALFASVSDDSQNIGADFFLVLHCSPLGQ